MGSEKLTLERSKTGVKIISSLYKSNNYVSGLSSDLSVARTKVHRSLSDLKDLNFVNELEKSKPQYYEVNMDGLLSFWATEVLKYYPLLKAAEESSESKVLQGAMETTFLAIHDDDELVDEKDVKEEDTKFLREFGETYFANVLKNDDYPHYDATLQQFLFNEPYNALTHVLGNKSSRDFDKKNIRWLYRSLQRVSSINLTHHAARLAIEETID